MSRTADVVIVGGGLIGCSLGAELAARGRSVVVVERGEPGGEASGAAAGMLSPQADAVEPSPFFDLALESRELYPDWARQALEETGIDIGYRRTGLLRVLSAGSAEEGAARASARWQTARGLRVGENACGNLTPEIARRLGPARRLGTCLFYPDEGVVDPRRATRAAWRLAERRGACVETGTSVRRFVIAEGHCGGVETDAGAIASGAVVDAAGAWAAFDTNLPVPIPVVPVRGQIVELRLEGPPLPTVLSSEEVYLVPREDGGVLVGSTLEHAGYRKAVTVDAVRRLLDAAADLCPEVTSAQFVTAWAGLRPATPDGWPILGETGIAGLFLAAGHFRNGILLAPATARHMADVLEGRAHPGLAPFSIERFSSSPLRGTTGFSARI
jgi:glycine oxidase